MIAHNGQNYQWLLNGQPIQQDTGDAIVIGMSGTYMVEAWASSICPEQSAPYVILGINNLQETGYLEVFPNPVSDQVNFNFKTISVGVVYISVYDITGRKIFETMKNEQDNIIDLSNIGEGAYIYSITNTAGTLIYNGKLIVER